MLQAAQSLTPVAPAELPAGGSERAALAVEVRGLRKDFGENTALADLSFGVRPHQFVSIVGPSGCGKSTALRIIAGLLEATAGAVSVWGERVREPLSDAGMVFQAPVLLPWRGVLDNVLFACEMRGERAERYRARAQELIELAGLRGFERHYPHELSGGMQQRVSICRALLLRPRLLLMDEPFGALDVMTRERMGFELMRLCGLGEYTVLFVTHSISEAVLLSDAIVIMRARGDAAKPHTLVVDLPRPRTLATLRDSRFVELAAAVREEFELGHGS
jgi:NitT/TauT family transport system ATP-binding protein